MEAALKNLPLLTRYQPHLAEKIRSLDHNPWEFFLAENGEENLRKKDGRGWHYLHDPKNPSQEATDCFAKALPLSPTTLLIYGVGLGYFYRAAADWLREKEGHTILFLEDDLGVLQSLLASSNGEALLRDPKVVVFYLEENDADFAELIRGTLMLSLYQQPFAVQALPSYERKKKEAYSSLQSRIYVYVEEVQADLEYLTTSDLLERNHNENFLRRPEAFSAKGLKDAFRGTPAIICGAGASIENEIPLLASLQNRALLLAGGTAVTVLTSHHIRPHIALGIDPNMIHFSKVAAQVAFEVPYAYMDRLHHEVLPLIQAPKLYLGGKAGRKYGEAEGWFNQEIGWEDFLDDIGESVSTTAVRLALYMGCNPIILVGLDLGRKKESHYALGAVDHPLVSERKECSSPLRRIYRSDSVDTTVQFIKEGEWLGKVAKKNPNTVFMNASVGGKEIPNIALSTFQEVCGQLDPTPKDLRGILHTAIYSCAEPFVTSNEVQEVMKRWLQSMGKITDYCRSKNWEKIQKEPGYIHWLEPTDSILEKTVRYNARFWRRDEEDPTIRLKLLKRKSYIWGDLAREPAPEVFERGTWRKVEKDLAECTFVEGKKEGKALLYYPSGKIYAEENYHRDLLHGEQRYYYPDETVRSLLSFDKGKLHGKVQLFYPNGARKREIHFLQGERAGRERYWSSEGNLLFDIDYKQNLPYNIARGWFSNGLPRIKIVFRSPGIITTIQEWNAYGYPLRR